MLTKITLGSAASCQSKTDLLITLGGDGTILHATSLHSHGQVPPVLSFSLGTLGFLLPFDIAESKQAFHLVYASQAKVINRARLRCEAYHDRRMHAPKTDKQLISVTHAMNDISIHRGADPHLTHLDIYANGQFVTRGISDGVVISTPTGSTAYSLSCGGSMVHPSVPCTLLTPICPRSLSFRPLIFPLSTKIEVRISDQSRGQNAELSIDGLRKGVMGPGDSIFVGPEKEGHNTGIWCVVKGAGDWMSNLNNLLGFNALFGDKK